MDGQHPIVGAWRVAVEVAGNQGPTNLAMIAADGTMLVAFPSPTPAAPGANHRLEYWTPAVGSWLADGERGATMTFVALGADEKGTAIGTHTVTATVTADASGQGWSGPFTITVAGQGGNVLASVSGTVTATRIPATADRAP